MKKLYEILLELNNPRNVDDVDIDAIINILNAFDSIDNPKGRTNDEYILQQYTNVQAIKKNLLQYAAKSGYVVRGGGGSEYRNLGKNRNI